MLCCPQVPRIEICLYYEQCSFDASPFRNEVKWGLTLILESPSGRPLPRLGSSREQSFRVCVLESGGTELGASSVIC